MAHFSHRLKESPLNVTSQYQDLVHSYAKEKMAAASVKECQDWPISIASLNNYFTLN